MLVMEASTPRSPSQSSLYERGGFGSYSQPSTYPSPAKTEADPSNYMTDALGLYNYGQMPMPNHAVHPAPGLYPVSPHSSEAWTPSLTTSASPSIMDGQPVRAWADPSYESVGRSPMASWDPQFQYAPSGSIVDARHSPAPTDPRMFSHRSSVSSTYDHSLYSQDGSESTFAPQIKVEQQTEWLSDEEMIDQPPLTVSPDRLGASSSYAMAQSDDGTVNTSTARTRSRSATTAANANYDCKLCGKLFQRSYNHKAHMETHDPKREYPHSCTAAGCGRKFVRRTDLVRHEQSVHIKARNHRCAACDAHFARKDTLRRHTEDGCPKRFEVKQAQREAAARGRNALPMNAGHHGLPQHPQHMPTPYFQHETFPPSPQ